MRFAITITITIIIIIIASQSRQTGEPAGLCCNLARRLDRSDWISERSRDDVQKEFHQICETI